MDRTSLFKIYMVCDRHLQKAFEIVCILEGQTAHIDQPEYFIGNVDKILGILMMPFSQ